MSDIRFARVPRRLTQALLRNEVTLHEYALMVYLVAVADHKTFVATFPSLRALSDGVSWDQTDQTLRRDLKRLKARGEIDFESGQGRRGAYDIRVCHADYFGKPDPLQHDFKQNTPSKFEVTSTRTPVTPPGNPHGNNDEGLSRLQHTDSPIDVAVDVDVDGDKDPDLAIANGDGGAGNEKNEKDAWEFSNEWKTDPDPQDRLASLVAQLHGSDEETLSGFRREFGPDITQAEYRWLLECLYDRPADKPVRNGAAYARQVLRERRERDRRSAA